MSLYFADNGKREIMLKTTENQRLLWMALEQIDEAIILTNPSGEIQYVNPAFENLSGYSYEEALQQNPRILKSGIQGAEFYDTMWKSLTEGNVWHGRISNRKKDGSIYTADVTISPVRSEAGSIISFIGIQKEITHKVELETQLIQSQKLEAVGSLAAGIAHEINTPIQFIGGNTEFLGEAFQELTALIDSIEKTALDSISDETDRQKFFEIFDEWKQKCDYSYFREEIGQSVSQTLEGVHRVSSIVSAMKDFSHPDEGEMSKADINDIIETTLTVARNEYKYVADIELDLDTDLPEIDCLRNKLHQVFLNLIVNAAHAIESKLSGSVDKRGKIVITTCEQDDHIVVTFADNGSGIEEEHREHVFEQFFTTKDVGRGTGQGLALSRAIITETHFGAISFATEVNVGTTFIICLPITQNSSPSLPEGASMVSDFGNTDEIEEEC
jgi:two-component system, NtrC family, sensor kinase